MSETAIFVEAVSAQIYPEKLITYKNLPFFDFFFIFVKKKSEFTLIIDFLA
jgi:hypothetical protein